MSLCAQTQFWIQERLDDSKVNLGSAEVASYQAHLESCAHCQAFEADMRTIRDAFEQIPVRPMPDEALESVLDQTVRAEQAEANSQRARSKIYIWGAVAAGVLIAATVFLWKSVPLNEKPAETYSAAEVEEASNHLLWALGITHQALEKSKGAAGTEIREIDRSLQKLPFRLPISRKAESNRGEL